MYVMINYIYILEVSKTKYTHPRLLVIYKQLVAIHANILIKQTFEIIFKKLPYLINTSHVHYDCFSRFYFCEINHLWKRKKQRTLILVDNNMFIER